MFEGIWPNKKPHHSLCNVYPSKLNNLQVTKNKITKFTCCSVNWCDYLALLCWFQTSLLQAALPLWWWYFCIKLYVKISPSERQSGERQASMIQTLLLSSKLHPIQVIFMETLNKTIIMQSKKSKNILITYKIDFTPLNVF